MTPIVLGLLSGIGDQMLSLFIIFVFLVIFAIVVGIKIKHVDKLGKVPKWLIPFIMFVEVINNFTKTNIGRRWKHYAPYFFTLGISILLQNICTIFGMMNPTSYIVTNAALAIITFFMIQITGIRSLGIKNYLKSFIGPVPALCIIMIPINIISELALPLSLTLRLTGNIIAGNVIEQLITSIGFGTFIIMPFINMYFDLMSGAIQALVFVVLTIVFTSMKIDDSEKTVDDEELADNKKIDDSNKLIDDNNKLIEQNN